MTALVDRNILSKPNRCIKRIHNSIVTCWLLHILSRIDSRQLGFISDSSLQETYVGEY